MIQRQQTLWLLLATLAAILTFMFPFATGEELVDKTTMRRLVELNAGKDFFIIVLTIASVCVSTVTIFLFKDRKLQLRLCVLGIVLATGILILYIIGMQKLLSATPALWAVLPVVVLASYIMAFRLIRKDEKLVKSLDKLR
jgi:peptidoglycan/LPS O-acetylase OafA/YrhL